MRVASVATGEILDSCVAHAEQVRDVLYSTDGNRIISASKDRSIGVWDAETLGPVARLAGHTVSVASLDMDASGERLISTSIDRTLKTWGTELLRHGNLRYPMKDVVGFSTDGEIVYTMSSDWQVTAHDIQSGEALRPGLALPLISDRFNQMEETGIVLTFGKRLEAGSSSSETSLHFPDGGQTLIEGQVSRFAGTVLGGREVWIVRPDFTVALFDSQSAEQLLVLEGSVADCKALTIDTEERWIAAGDDGRFTIRIRDRLSGQELTQLDGHSNQIEDLEFSADGKWLLSASDDHTVRVWRTGTWQEIAVLESHGGMDVRATFHPDGTRLASVSSDGLVRLWSTDAWDEVLAVPLPDEPGRAQSIQFSPSGDQLFVLMESGLHRLDAR